jgi:hypothetical protein
LELIVRYVTLSAALLVSTLSVCSDGRGMDQSWVPTLKDISELEGKVRMPKGAAPLKTFTREYAGRVEKGHRIIIGVYSGSGGQILIDKSTQEPDDSTLDGGCGIVNVKYDVTTQRGVDVRCHGEA